MKSHDKATIWEKAGYGFGDMSSSMFWKIFSYYLPFFYSNVFGLSLAHAGTLLLITKLYDAVFNQMGHVQALSSLGGPAFCHSRGADIYHA